MQGMWVDGTEVEQKTSVMLAKGADELSFLFLPLRENRVPVILIGLRDRFLTLAPAIIRGCGRLWLSFSLGWRFNRSFAFLRNFDRSAFLRRRLLFRRCLRFLVVTSHQFSRLFWLFSPVATPAHKPPTHLRSVGLRLATRELVPLVPLVPLVILHGKGHLPQPHDVPPSATLAAHARSRRGR